MFTGKKIPEFFPVSCLVQLRESSFFSGVFMNQTDWNRYYSSPLPTAYWSRAVIRKHLLRMFKKADIRENFSIAELGGGGSCFCEMIRKKFKIKNYTVYDSCQLGLNEFLKKNPDCKTISTDLLQWTPVEKYDLVFSVGLIEHFSPEHTALLIRKHFEMTKDGGCVILFAPTPTLIYRVTRSIAELFRLWQFPDERPLKKEELRKTADQCGTYLKGYTIYTNFLSQYAVIYRKH